MGKGYCRCLRLRAVRFTPLLLHDSVDITIIIIIIIIIPLFQEDDIFGTNASLTYGPRLQR